MAEELGFVYVDTGAMYRAMGLYFLRKGIPLEDEGAVSASCGEISVDIAYENGVQQVLLNGENVTALLREEAVGNTASKVSAYPAVRAALMDLQRGLAASYNVIMDGRDIGSLVLPKADCKIYLTASTRVRAVRRYKELEAKGEAVSLEEVEQKIIDRDNRDMTRETAPLIQAEDAVYLDASAMTIDQVVERIKELARERGLEA